MTTLHCIVKECPTTISLSKGYLTRCSSCGDQDKIEALHLVPSTLHVVRWSEYNPDWTQTPHENHHLLCDRCLAFHTRQFIKFQLLYDGCKDGRIR